MGGRLHRHGFAAAHAIRGLQAAEGYVRIASRQYRHLQGANDMKAQLPERPADTELIAKILSGDMRAMEELMRTHNRMLYRTARAILRDDAEAEDAVQEAYLQAYQALGTFRGESKLSTWLVRIAANEALMRRRRNSRSAAIVQMDGTAHADEAHISGLPGPEDDAERSEVRRLL